MTEFLQFVEGLGIDWVTVLSVVWTAILVPIGKVIYDWLKSKKLDKYAIIVYDEVVKAVKGVYEAIVKDVKHTEDWTPEKQAEVRELAKTKAKQALSNSILKCLRQANGDFDEYLDSLIDTALFDVKNEIK